MLVCWFQLRQMLELLKLLEEVCKRSFSIKSGAVTGMLVAGLALLAIAVYYYLLLKFNINEREIVNALVALGFGAFNFIFARLGGIFY